MRALGPVGVSGESVTLTQRVEEVAAPGEDLVDVGLVPGVEDDRVGRRVEDPVQGNGELHDPQVGTQVSAGGRDLLDEELTDLPGKVLQLGGGQ